MQLLHKISNRIKTLFRSGKAESDLDEEMRFHLEMEMEKNRQRGMSVREAERSARIAFGGVEQMKEECRDAWGIRLVTDTLADIQFGLKQFRKNKGFTIVSLLTIAFCFSLNIAIYSYIQSWLFNSFDYPDEDAVVAVGKFWPKEGNRLDNLSALSFVEIEREATSFKAMGLLQFNNSVNAVIQGGHPFVVADSTEVTADIWNVVGVRPILGHVFTPESLAVGGDRVVVISYPFWQTRFDGNPDVIKHKIRLDGREYSIIGVMPEGFNMVTAKTSLWIPKVIQSWELKEKYRELNKYWAIARLNEGVSAKEAQTELDQLFRHTFENHPERQAEWTRAALGYKTLDLQDAIMQDLQFAVVVGSLIMQLSVLSILVIGCLNITGLTFVRGMARIKEIAMRSNLGANRLRILKQLITETLLLFLLGGIFSVPLVWGVKELMYQSLFSEYDFPEAYIDVFVIIFAGLILLFLGIFFGLLPARSILNLILRPGFSDSDRSYSCSKSRGYLQKTVMVIQVALACSLLVIAGTSLKNAFAVMAKDYGFAVENRFLVKVDLPKYLYPNSESVHHFIQTMKGDIAQLPGIINVAYANRVPLAGYNNWFTEFEIIGQSTGENDPQLRTTIYQVDPDYFEAMGIPVLKGRVFNTGDVKASEMVAIIDAQNAEDYFQERDPLGAMIRFGGKEYRVIGVVGQTINAPKYFGVKLDRALYFSNAQWDTNGTVSFVVHCNLSKDLINTSIQKMVREVNSELAQIEVITLKENIADSVRAEIVMSKLTIVFSVVACLLTLMGIYGVVSNVMQEQRKAIGIRLAIGARTSSVIFEYLQTNSILTMTGLLFGTILAYLGIRFIKPFYLTEVESVDVLIFIGVPLSILLCSVVTTLGPIIRMIRISPAETLRYE